MEDPFVFATADLEQVFKDGREIQQRTSSSGFVSAADYQNLTALYRDAEELLKIVKDALKALNDKGGRINDHIFSANEIVQRQNTVHIFESEMENLKVFYESLRKRQEAVQQAPVSATTPPEGQDHYVQLQENAQQAEIAHQQEIMDRLSHGLQELRETGIGIRTELNEQNESLEAVDNNISAVQARLRSANQKLDAFLGSLSTSKKMMVILVLVALVIILYILF